MSIQQTINSIRNRMVANKSHVTDPDVKDEKIVSQFGKNTEIREVTNGGDVYYVGQRERGEYKREEYTGDIHDLATARTSSVDFAVLHQGKVAEMSIMQSSHIYNPVHGIGIYEREISLTIDDEEFKTQLKADTDIHDINAVRFQLGEMPEEASLRELDAMSKMAHFIDKFVIVTPEERKKYQEYVEIQERKAKAAQKEEERRARFRAAKQKLVSDQQKKEKREQQAANAVKQRRVMKFVGKPRE